MTHHREIQGLGKLQGWLITLLIALPFPLEANAKGGGKTSFFSLGFTFGVQGGSVNRLPETATDTRTTGFIGLSTGVQAGGVARLGPLEFRALYDLKRVVADDIVDESLPETTYTDQHLTIPVLWTRKVGSMIAGGGLFYSMPLDATTREDGGIALSSKYSAEKIPFDADFTCFAGAFRQPSEGNNIRCMAGIGFRLR